MILKKVISGGQIGADMAGVHAAERCGLQTGGWMPKGYKTIEGHHAEHVVKLYNFYQTDTEDYPPRTELNVQQSDATIRFAYNYNSPGERLTQRLVGKYKKPSKDIFLSLGPPAHILYMRPIEELIEITADWLIDNEVKTLNVAGNANRVIEDIVFDFLFNVFKFVKMQR